MSGRGRGSTEHWFNFCPIGWKLGFRDLLIPSSSQEGFFVGNCLDSTEQTNYDQRLRTKEKINTNVCFQEKGKRKKTFSPPNPACANWRGDDSVDKAIVNCCSCRGPLITSEYTWGTLPPSLTGDPEDMRSCPCLYGHSHLCR